MTRQELQQRWDQLTPESRRKAILKDRSMRDPRWKALVDQMSSSDYGQLTEIQRAAVEDFLAGTRS